MIQRTLAVGERMHLDRCWKPRIVRVDSFDLRLRMGAFEPKRPLLDKLGVCWDDAINLLWPSPVVGDWNSAEALRTATILTSKVLTYRWVLLFGARVCQAFGVPFEVGKVFGRLVPLPHPSGRNRLWNSPEVRKTVKEVMEVVTCTRSSTRKPSAG